MSYENLKKKKIKELAFILDSAIVGQIRALKSVPEYDTNLYSQLRKFIKKFRKNYKLILDL